MNTLIIINCISQTGLFEVLAIKAKHNTAVVIKDSS